MKTSLTLLFLAVLFISGGSKQDQTGYDKKQAFENFTVCSRIADKWLKTLDSTEYLHLLSLESVRDENDLAIASYIGKIRTEYGKVTGRKFLGSHIYFYASESLLTYVPDIEDKNLAHINAARSEDGFYIVDPKYFGLSSYKQMFSGFPEGDYVILMYEVSTANKSTAEEKLTFLRARWNNPGGKWQLVGYLIADEI